MTIAKPAHKRILLKLSGEALMGDDQFGINRATIVRMVNEIAEVTRLGVQVAVVIGGGNIFRGVAGGAVGMDRATADYMGMLATVMNSLALADTMEKAGLTARVMSAIAIEQVVEPYVRPKALQYLEEGKVVIFAAGTGNPFFTTDTAAALRGAEIGAELVLKATKVDGVYSADPKLDPAATRYSKLSFDEAISKNLGIMDATAFALCRDQKLPVKVFSIFKHGAFKRVVMGFDAKQNRKRESRADQSGCRVTKSAGNRSQDWECGRCGGYEDNEYYVRLIARKATPDRIPKVPR